MDKMPLLENEYIEFKEGFSNFEKDICAFANSKGGKVYIGITDQGKVKKIQLTNKLNSQIVSSINSIEPRPEFNIKQESDIIVISVKEGENKPYKASDGFYVRIGATSQKLKRDEILQFFISENRIHFDQQAKLEVLNESAILELLNQQQIQWFRHRAGLNEQITDIEQFINLGLINKNGNKYKITNACLLLFSKDIKQHFSNTDSTLFIMQNAAAILDQKIITGNIIHQLDHIIKYLRANLLRSFVISGLQRDEIDEIPEFVLRELVLNGLIHRDYFEQGASFQIKIFPEHLEFSNPGNILHHLKPEELYGKSFQRNPLLASIMLRAGYIEKAGTGLIRIREYLRKNNFKNLQIKEEGIFFSVVLTRPSSKAVNDELSENQTKILKLLKKSSNGLSAQKITSKLNCSDRKVRADLLILKNQKLIEARRKGRGILYFLS